MKLSRLLCMLLFCAFTVLFAQQSIGFSESATTQSLLDYRLPSWGTSLLALDFELNTSDNFASYEDYNRRNASYSLLIYPYFERFRESESLYRSLTASFYPFGNINITETSYTDIDSLQRMQENQINIGAYLEYLQNSYSAKYFIQTAATLEGDFSQYKTKSTSSDSDLDIRRTIGCNANIGIGIGRIRNVTPVIRALRFRERVQSLAKGLDISEAQLQDLAHVIAQNSGYYSIYDRSDKYFWSDIFDLVPHVRPAITNYEYHYLCDMMDEVIGTRYAGWDAVAGIQFRERHNYHNRPLADDRFLGLYIDVRYYKNIDLKQQVGITGNLYSAANLREDLFKRTDGYAKVQLSYLNSLADRFLLTANLNFSIYTGNVQSHYLGSIWEQRHSAQINLTYFIENHLQLSSWVSLSHYKEENGGSNLKRQTTAGSGISLTYYFDRRLLH